MGYVARISKKIRRFSKIKTTVPLITLETRVEKAGKYSAWTGGRTNSGGQCRRPSSESARTCTSVPGRTLFLHDLGCRVSQQSLRDLGGLKGAIVAQSPRVAQY